MNAPSELSKKVRAAVKRGARWRRSTTTPMSIVTELPWLMLSELIDQINAFDGDEYSAELRQRGWTTPLTAVTIYFVFVFAGQSIMADRDGLALRQATGIWNFTIAVFSIVGAYFCVPHLYRTVVRNGLRYTICTPATEWYYDGVVGWCSFAFMWSKFFEFVDTIFLGLRKREVIFLHWYHHITVLLFCWHSISNQVGNGFWFATMNYSVHAIMYSYYFFMGFERTRRIVRPIAPFITAMQIFQMMFGLGILSETARQISHDVAALSSNADNMPAVQRGCV
jgi:elongation of very long chain fatty acids protein 6